MSCRFVSDPQPPEVMTLQSWNECGIDEEAPFPQIEMNNNVEIPESRVTLCVFNMSLAARQYRSFARSDYTYIRKNCW